MTAAHVERSLCSWAAYAWLIWWVLGILWETWPIGGSNLMFGSSVSCPEDIGEVSVPGEHKPMLHEKQWSPWESNCHLSHEEWACSTDCRWAACWSGVNNPCRAGCSGPQEKNLSDTTRVAHSLKGWASWQKCGHLSRSICWHGLRVCSFALRCVLSVRWPWWWLSCIWVLTLSTWSDVVMWSPPGHFAVKALFFLVFNHSLTKET